MPYSEIKKSVHEATGVLERPIERIIKEGNTASYSDEKKVRYRRYRMTNVGSLA